MSASYLRRSKEEADKDRVARQIEIDDWEERVFDNSDDWCVPQPEEANLILE